MVLTVIITESFENVFLLALGLFACLWAVGGCRRQFGAQICANSFENISDKRRAVVRH